MVTKEEVDKAKSDYEAKWTVAYSSATAACDEAWDKYWKLKMEFEANDHSIS